MSPWMDMNDTDAHDKRVGWRDLTLLKTLWPIIRPHRFALLVTVLLLPLVSLTQVAMPWLIKEAIDGPVKQGNIAGLMSLSIAFLVVMTAHYALRYTQMVWAQMTGQKIVYTLRTQLYDHLQSLSPGFYHATPLGKLVTRISADVENISEVFSSGGIAIFADLAVIIGIMGAMLWMNVTLSLVIFAMVPVIVLTMEFFRRRSRAAYNQQRVKLAELNIQLQESLTGIDVIQLTQKEGDNQQRFDQRSRELMDVTVRSVVYDSAFTASVEVLSLTSLVGVLAVVLFLYGQPAFAGITLGLIMAFLQYIQMLFEPVEELSDKFTVIQSGLASLDKIVELLSVKPDTVSPAIPKPPQTCQPSGRLEIENLVFGYDPEVPILKSLSLTIEPGEKLAIIGATGAGKSTLIKLLSRQYDPQSGRILLDGVDLRDWDLPALKRKMVVIAQEDFLFSRTIADNITLDYATPPDLDKLHVVTASVHATMITDRLNEGFNTVLSERGRSLSSGERQLLVFARALWHSPEVIILDEATSAIDPQTERLIQTALDQILVGRTAIMIAHRLKTIEAADRIIVLEHGQIVEQGAPEDLLAQRGRYWEYLSTYHSHAELS